MNVAVILAGGSGTRLGNDVPKQFMKLAGKQVIEHTIDVFENSPLIDEICIVSRSDFVADVEALVVKNNYRKVKKILNGGKERYDSSLAAINAYTDDTINMLFHDAVRPLVSERIINDCIVALDAYNAVATGIMTTDTIWEVSDGAFISSIPDRTVLRNAQTPQCFLRGTISRAYERALADPGFSATDDCGVVTRYLPEEKIFVVEGDSSNIKITYREDLLFAEQIFKLRNVGQESV